MHLEVGQPAEPAPKTAIAAAHAALDSVRIDYTAALGIPTLDGLGGVGEGAHAADENILVNRIADRTALLAGLVEAL